MNRSLVLAALLAFGVGAADAPKDAPKKKDEVQPV